VDAERKAAVEPLERLLAITNEIFQSSDSDAPLESIASAVSSAFRVRGATVLQPARDLLTLVLPNVDGDGEVPSMATLEQMQVFLNLVGLALANARVVREQRDRIAAQAEALEATQKLLLETKHATTDPLTGIANRRIFDEHLSHEWHRSERSGAPLAIIFIDVDEFKAFNDEYGHVAGDHCLKQIADCIAVRLKRPDDLFARYGGEEFAILLPITDEAGALVIADNLCRNVFELNIVHENSKLGFISISAGVASLVPKFEEAFHASLVKAAGTALHRAKDAGRNCAVAASALRTTQW
jgi:diguanylate cyclase (GGDEF)-like protein